MSALTRFILKRLPASTKLRIADRLLRSISGEHRAFSDLFVPPYCRWIPWDAGNIGEGIHVLYGLCRAMRPETVVEIGSARGYSTCGLALACRQNGKGKVYAIDPHEPNLWTVRGAELADQHYEFFMSRMRDYELIPTWCEPMRARSSEVAREWNKPIDLLFIDGDHSYEGVKGDFEGFRPWLREHSLVVFHDTLWEFKERPEANSQRTRDQQQQMGVPRFLEELRQDGYHSVTVDVGPGVTVLCPAVGGAPFLRLDLQASHPQSPAPV